MDDLWRELMKLLTLIALLLGSGDFSKMARESFKRKLKKNLQEKVEKFEKFRSMD